MKAVAVDVAEIEARESALHAAAADLAELSWNETGVDVGDAVVEAVESIVDGGEVTGSLDVLEMVLDRSAIVSAYGTVNVGDIGALVLQLRKRSRAVHVPVWVRMCCGPTGSLSSSLAAVRSSSNAVQKSPPRWRRNIS